MKLEIKTDKPEPAVQLYLKRVGDCVVVCATNSVVPSEENWLLRFNPDGRVGIYTPYYSEWFKLDTAGRLEILK